jgi:hypothetical protein
MKGKRVFTDEELREMSTRTLDLVIEAIDAGDKERAKELARRMYREFNHLHDGYFTWVTGLLSFIYKNYGIEVLEQAEREAHTIEAKFVFKSPPNQDFRSRVQALAGGFQGHLQPITVAEDDEKVTITMKPCGSGERIIKMGGYEPDIGLARVKEAHPITWGLKDFPIYCVHCPVMEMLDIERSGDFGSVHIISDPIGQEHCQFALYKDNADIPEESYKRIGKEKPYSK